MRCWVARTPGWESECKCSKMGYRNELRTYGRCLPVETSHEMVNAEPPTGTLENLREVDESLRWRSSVTLDHSCIIDWGEIMVYCLIVSTGYDVSNWTVIALDVANIGSELGDIVQMSGLSGRVPVGVTKKIKSKRFMVSQYTKLLSFHIVSEVFDGEVDREQFSIECAQFECEFYYSDIEIVPYYINNNLLFAI